MERVPEDAGDEERSGEQAWYFDLPDGAWERQEQKNRDLRKNVVENASKEEELRKGPFATSRPQHDGEDEPSATLPREEAPKPVDDVPWERRPLLRRAGRPADERPSAPPPAEEPPPASKWDALFAAPAEGGNLVEAMRHWAKNEPPPGEPPLPVEPPREPLPFPVAQHDAEPGHVAAASIRERGGTASGEPAVERDLFDWDPQDEVTPPWAAKAVPGGQPAKKGGLVSRLFGRKKAVEPEPRLPDLDTSVWAPAAERTDDAGEPDDHGSLLGALTAEPPEPVSPWLAAEPGGVEGAEPRDVEPIAWQTVSGDQVPPPPPAEPAAVAEPSDWAPEAVDEQPKWNVPHTLDLGRAKPVAWARSGEAIAPIEPAADSDSFSPSPATAASSFESTPAFTIEPPEATPALLPSGPANDEPLLPPWDGLDGWDEAEEPTFEVTPAELVVEPAEWNAAEALVSEAALDELALPLSAPVEWDEPEEPVFEAAAGVPGVGAVPAAPWADLKEQPAGVPGNEAWPDPAAAYEAAASEPAFDRWEPSADAPSVAAWPSEPASEPAPPPVAEPGASFTAAAVVPDVPMAEASPPPPASNPFSFFDWDAHPYGASPPPEPSNVAALPALAAEPGPPPGAGLPPPAEASPMDVTVGSSAEDEAVALDLHETFAQSPGEEAAAAAQATAEWPLEAVPPVDDRPGYEEVEFDWGASLDQAGSPAPPGVPAPEPEPESGHAPWAAGDRDGEAAAELDWEPAAPAAESPPAWQPAAPPSWEAAPAPVAPAFMVPAVRDDDDDHDAGGPPGFAWGATVEVAAEEEPAPAAEMAPADADLPWIPRVVPTSVSGPDPEPAVEDIWAAFRVPGEDDPAAEPPAAAARLEEPGMPAGGSVDWLSSHFPEADVEPLSGVPLPEAVLARPRTAQWALGQKSDPEGAELVPASDDYEPDLVVRAFEAHANTPEPAMAGWVEPTPHEPGAFRDLLGDEGDALVNPPAEPETYARIQGWAPQRPLAPTPLDDLPTESWTERALPLDSPWGRASGEPAGVAPEWVEAGEESEARASDQRRAKKFIRELVETGLLALLVFLAVRASFQNFRVDGSSMFPTLEDGQFLIVNKLVYSEIDVDKMSDFLPFLEPGEQPKRYVFHGPERGDIIVLRDPRKPDTDLIKRVIGLPGDGVEIVQGKVYINDRRLDEPYITREWHGSMTKIVIPPGQYFVMGDNRENSLDSRSSQVGLVHKDLIIGKAMLSYWPSEKFGLAENHTPRITNEPKPQTAAEAAASSLDAGRVEAVPVSLKK